jgi:WD40 repeat protein
MKHTAPISSVATWGSYVATGGYDNRVILWNAATRKALAQGWHDHLVNHCAFSSNGKWLVTAGSDYSARIWELPSLRLKAVLTDHADDVDMAVFSPNDTWVATCALDRAVRIFNLSGTCIQTLLGHTGNIISLLWSQDGQRLVSSSVDGTVREWDVAQGTQISCYNLDGVRTDTIAMDSQGRIIAGDDEGRIAIIIDGKPHYHPAHQAGIKKIVYCETQQLLASLSYDRTLAFWKITDNQQLIEVQRTVIPAIIWARAAAMLEDGKLVVGTFGTSYAIYDWYRDNWDTTGISAGNSINAITYHRGHVYTVGDAGIVHRDNLPFSNLGSLCNFILSAGDRLYAGGQLGQLFDVSTGQVVYQHHSPINCGTLFYQSSQACLAIGTYTGEMLVFAVQPVHGLQFIKAIKIYDNAIKGIVANKQKLFSVCASTDIAWHNCHDLSLIAKISKAHKKIANACCSVGENGFASVSRDRQLRLWLNGIQEAYVSPHPNSIKCVCASPDGKTLMSGSYGGTVAAFDVPSRTWTVFERPTTAGISALSYDTDQQCFLATSYDGQVYPISYLAVEAFCHEKTVNFPRQSTPTITELPIGGPFRPSFEAILSSGHA